MDQANTKGYGIESEYQRFIVYVLGIIENRDSRIEHRLFRIYFVE